MTALTSTLGTRAAVNLSSVRRVDTRKARTQPWKDVLSQEEAAAPAVDRLNILMLTPRFTENERTTSVTYKMKWRNVQNTENEYDLNIGQAKELNFINPTATRYCCKNTVPPESWVKVGKRNEDDSRGEINHKKR